MAAWMALASSKLASWHQLMTAAWTGAEHSSSSSEGFWFVVFATMSSIELDCLGVFLLQSSLRSFDGGLPLYFWELLGAFGGRGRDFGRDFGGDLPSSLHFGDFLSLRPLPLLLRTFALCGMFIRIQSFPHVISRPWSILNLYCLAIKSSTRATVASSVTISNAAVFLFAIA